MSALSSHNILRVWEAGQHQHLVDRALTMLGFACPELQRADMAKLTIGQRDTLLFNIREQTFGSILKGFAECPQCRDCMEFTMSTADMMSRQNTKDGENEYPFELPEYDVTFVFRLPDSTDLAALVECKDVVTARKKLIQRCALHGTCKGNPITSIELSEEVIKCLADRMADCDPQADLNFDFECPACQFRWQQPFDIVSFFWSEIAIQAKRLLREIHTLAHAYGWRETDILSMNPIRRRYYLEMINT